MQQAKLYRMVLRAGMTTCGPPSVLESGSLGRFAAARGRETAVFSLPKRGRVPLPTWTPARLPIENTRVSVRPLSRLPAPRTPKSCSGCRIGRLWGGCRCRPNAPFSDPHAASETYSRPSATTRTPRRSRDPQRRVLTHERQPRQPPGLSARRQPGVRECHREVVPGCPKAVFGGGERESQFGRPTQPLAGPGIRPDCARDG